MIRILIAFLSSSLLTLFAIPKIIHFSLKLKLFDDQDLYRKTHMSVVSRMGGIAIFFGYILVMNFYLNFTNVCFHALMASSTIIFFLGLKDDLLGGAVPSEKFLIQLLAVIVLVLFNDPDLNMNFLSTYISSGSGLVDVFLPIGLLLTIVNGFNFIDGIDGLAGILGVSVNVFIGSYLIYWGDNEFGTCAFIIAGSTSGFLRYNLIPGKVFMGDSGAMLIGLTTGAICLRFMHLSSLCIDFQYSSPLLVVCSLLVVPIFDVFRIFVIRTLHGKPLLVGDRNHLHHRLQDLGLRDFQSTFVLITFTALCLGIVFVGKTISSFATAIALSLFCIVCNTCLSYLRGCHLSPSYKISDILFIDTLNLR